MASVVPPLKAHDALCAFSQPVDQFAFAFVAPLSANDYDIATFDCVH
jgi:hypothetical protein